MTYWDDDDDDTTNGNKDEEDDRILEAGDYDLGDAMGTLAGEHDEDPSL